MSEIAQLLHNIVQRMNSVLCTGEPVPIVGLEGTKGERSELGAQGVKGTKGE